MIVKDITKWEVSQKQKFQENSPNFQKEVKAGTEKGYDFQGFSQDLFSSLYQLNPQISEKSTMGTQWARQALQTMQELPEFKKLRNLGTVGRSFDSGLGSIILTKHFAESLPVKETKNPDQMEAEIEGLLEWLKQNPDHPKAKEIQKKIKDNQTALPASQEEWGNPLDEQGVRIAARKALQNAYQEIQDVNATAGAFGFGTEEGADGYSNPETKLALANHIRSNPTLQRIADLAGRFKAEAQKTQANKKVPGPDELSDVELGSSLGRILPSEGMKATDPLFEMEFFQKLTESKLMQYYLEALDKKARGPIIVCLDNSGSMGGEKEIWSKAIALALCRVAVDQNRAFQILHFNTRVCRVDTFDSADVDPEALIESCAYFAGGGTDFEPVMTQAFETIRDAADKDLRQADVIFITDGIAPINPDFQERIAQLKTETGASLHSVCLDAPSPELKSMSEYYIELHDLSDDSDDAQNTKEHMFSL